MAIKGLTDRAGKFVNIGTLRKGAEKPVKGPGRDLDHFRFDTDDQRAAEMFRAAYGAEPKAVNIYLPYASADQNFQAWRESWTASQLNHRCDGETTYTYDASGMLVSTGKPCPDLKKADDDRNRCKQVGRLMVIIPELARFAYVTVLTSSIHDIYALSEQLTAIEALRGSLQGIPMIISRNEREISMPKQDGSRVRVKKWMLAVEVAPEWAALQLQSMHSAALQLAAPAVRALPSPATPQPDHDDEPSYTIENEEPRQPREADKLSTCNACGVTIAWAHINGRSLPYEVVDGVRQDARHKCSVPAPAEESSAKVYTPAQRERMIGKIRQQMRDLDSQFTDEERRDNLTMDLEEMDSSKLAELGSFYKFRLEAEPGYDVMAAQPDWYKSH